jgi:ankyrin repeat protein
MKIKSTIIILCFLSACSSKKEEAKSNTGAVIFDESKSTINKPSEPPIGALSKAVKSKNTTTILTLLTLGSNVNESIYDGEGNFLTPVLIAIGNKDLETVHLLINNGASLNVTYEGFTAEELLYDLELESKFE